MIDWDALKLHVISFSLLIIEVALLLQCAVWWDAVTQLLLSTVCMLLVCSYPLSIACLQVQAVMNNKLHMIST